MTTENGLELVRHARHNIEVIRARREFLSQRIAVRVDNGDERLTGFDRSELRALDWALPIIEAEWDRVARMRRNVEGLERRLANLERRGIEVDPRSAPEWR